VFDKRCFFNKKDLIFIYCTSVVFAQTCFINYKKPISTKDHSQPVEVRYGIRDNGFDSQSGYIKKTSNKLVVLTKKN